MSKINSLNELFIQELQILLSGEEQLVKALPEMAKAAHAKELKNGFAQHLEQTRGHAERLRSILSRLGAPAKAKACPAMEGLIEAGKTRIKLDAPDMVRDAALIVAGQRVEHFEIAGYGSAKTFAQLLGHGDFADELEQIEEEEVTTDQTLTSVAERLNAQALVETT